MAIIDKDQNKWYINDRDEKTFIGLKLPINLDQLNDASTETTLEAVKQNVKNICSTELGERVMQPNLGMFLKKFLFEPFTEETVFQIQETVNESLNYWLPFIKIDDIGITMSENTGGDFKNTMEVSVVFSLKKDPNTHESVQITVGE